MATPLTADSTAWSADTTALTADLTQLADGAEPPVEVGAGVSGGGGASPWSRGNYRVFGRFAAVEDQPAALALACEAGEVRIEGEVCVFTRGMSAAFLKRRATLRLLASER